jgi:hypothetical protein
VLTYWLLWRERNARIFDHTSGRTLELVKDVGKQWSMARFTTLLDEVQ